VAGGLPHGRDARLSLDPPTLDPAQAEAFILANTSLSSPPHVPEIRLHLADEAHGLWLKTEEELAAIGLPPPFWAFAWAGGQGLARFVLDHPETVADKRVLDFATGSGLVAVAAAMAGAAHVAAVDVDPFAASAVRLNAALNGVDLSPRTADIVGAPASELGADVLLAGDVFFDKPFADRLVPWFEALATAGLAILVGDPGRAYLPRERLAHRATYRVPVTRALEDAEIKETTVWAWAPKS
jgi:predicted nicotinamide N-methyase